MRLKTLAILFNKIFFAAIGNLTVSGSDILDANSNHHNIMLKKTLL